MRKTILKTKRLIIQPMENEEIQELIKKTEDSDLRQAYREMLEGCEADPKNKIWYAPWKICLKKEGTYIGDLGFKGTVKNNSVEIGYGILREYEGQGYTTEAAKAVIEWAFANPDVYFVEAETAPDNVASKRILEKLEFKPDGEGEEGPRYVKEAPDTTWGPIYMCFGVAIGMSFGSMMDNIPIGMSMGVAIGFCIGTALDASMKKKRESVRRQRKNSGIADDKAGKMQ